MDYNIRKYDKEKDKKAVHRIWKEVGWMEEGKEKFMDTFLEATDSLVVEINGEAEFLVNTSSGDILYQNEKLPFSGVSGVTTSRIARKLGLAQKVTPYLIAKDAEKGALVSGLGMFEQGFYNKLGYGTGSYEHIISFDPADLNIKSKFRIPIRFTTKDWKAIHKSKLNRLRKHGSINFKAAGITKAEMMWTTKSFGLGYKNNKTNEITHHIWGSNRGGEHGPYWISWLVFQNYEQLIELLALIKSLGDQVRLVSLTEPPNIQFQDFLSKPFRFRQLSEKSKFENKMKAVAWWQMRICNLEKCLEKTHLNCEDTKFNLELNDPIEKYLDNTFKWKGISGNHIITVGQNSFAEKGFDKSLQTIKASVGAFTRLWLGIRPASSLIVSDEFSAPQDLLEKLDIAFRISEPKTDWEF